MSADLAKKIVEETKVDEPPVFASAEVVGNMTTGVFVLEEGAKGFLPGPVQTTFMNHGRAQYAYFNFEVDDAFKNMDQNYVVRIFLNGERVTDGQMTGRPGVMEIFFRPIPRGEFDMTIECVLA